MKVLKAALAASTIAAGCAHAVLNLVLARI
ncbi:hypothetical protein FBZ92_12376 [Nitrospirillum viridazoti]|uniref:Lipoprotein n=1 Tax=Nitrospirillum amazonense TaxID=28077 RepID=A0A560HVL2_9PROT|nr:hypothetical protein FBZ92_12376 [Nitrospirillum amazonense]